MDGCQRLPFLSVTRCSNGFSPTRGSLLWALFCCGIGWGASVIAWLQRFFPLKGCFTHHLLRQVKADDTEKWNIFQFPRPVTSSCFPFKGPQICPTPAALAVGAWAGRGTWKQRGLQLLWAWMLLGRLEHAQNPAGQGSLVRRGSIWNTLNGRLLMVLPLLFFCFSTGNPTGNATHRPLF